MGLWQMKIHGGTVLGHDQSPNETNHMERVQILCLKLLNRSKKSPSITSVLTQQVVNPWCWGLSDKLMALIITCMNGVDSSVNLEQSERILSFGGFLAVTLLGHQLLLTS